MTSAAAVGRPERGWGEMDWSQLLHDFMLGAMIGDKESEDWVLAMLLPWLKGDGERRRGEGERPQVYQLPYRPTDTDMRGRVEQPIFRPGEDLPPEEWLLSAPGETESQAASAAGPEEAEPRWWEHGTRVEKRHHWHLEKGRSPGQARQLVEQERRVLESDIADPWSYLSYAARFGDQKYDEDGYVKPWDKLTGGEHVLEGWFRSQGLGKEEAQRRAAQEAYLLGPEGPKNLKSWLRHLGSLGPSMYDEEGRLKQPGTFATDENNVVSDVIYGSAEAMSRAEAERALAEMTRLAPDQLAPALEQDVAWTPEGYLQGPVTSYWERPGYQFVLTETPGEAAQVRMGEIGPTEERRSSREQTERQAWRNLILSHSMFDPDVLTLPIPPGPVGPPDGWGVPQPAPTGPGIRGLTSEERARLHPQMEIRAAPEDVWKRIREAFALGAKAKGEKMLGHLKAAVSLQGPGPADYGGASMPIPVEPRGTAARDRYEAAEAARVEGQRRAQEISDEAVSRSSEDPLVAALEGVGYVSGGIAVEEGATASLGVPGKAVKGGLKGGRAAKEGVELGIDATKNILRRGKVDPADLAAGRVAKGVLRAVDDDLPGWAKKGTPVGWLLKKGIKKGAKELINTVGDAVHALGVPSLSDAPPKHRQVLLGHTGPNKFVGLMVDAGAPLDAIESDLLAAGVSPEFTGRLMESAQRRMERNQQQAGRSGGGYGYGLYGTPGRRPMVQ